MAVIGSTPLDLDIIYKHRTWFFELRCRKPFDRKTAQHQIQGELDFFNDYLLRFYRRIGIKMPKKTEKKFIFNGYVNINILADFEAPLEKYISNNDQIWQDYVTAISSGYKFGIQFKDKDEAYVATLTCLDSSSDNFGYVLSAFASDAFSAMGVLMFKHSYIAERNWNSYKGQEKRSYG